MKYIDVEKLIAEIKGLQCEQGFEDGMEERGYQLAIKDILNIIGSLQQEQPSDMKSPFTGGKVTILSREEEVTFRGEKVKITRKYYRCEDTGREFTDSKLDDDMMWDTFRAYCEKKGITSFTDIMLKQEQQELDLEKAFESYLNNMIGQPRMWHPNEQIEWGKSIARHFYELGLNARKED